MPPTKTKSLRIPVPCHAYDLLKEKAENEDCSMSWLVCDAIMEYFGMSEEELFGGDWRRPAKTKTERRKAWEEGKRAKGRDKRTSKLLSNFEVLLLDSTEWLTVPEIEEKLGFSERSVRTAIKKFRDKGLLDIERFGFGGRMRIKLKDNIVGSFLDEMTISPW